MTMKLSIGRVAASSPTMVDELNLAASWYIALPSSDLPAGRPIALELFGQPLVAWRDEQRRPVLMPRHCPHMGASLADGAIVRGCLQCPFHQWRFAASGQCTAIPGIDRIPATARQPTYPVVERYGYVWAWYGPPAPLFPLPEIPALDTDGRGYRRFRFADTTAATVRRILENTYDPDHLAALHGLRVAGSLELTVLKDPRETHLNGPPIPDEAWFGASIEWPSYAGMLGVLTRLLRSNAQRFTLLVDGWPAGQRITYLADGRAQYTLLLAATPVGPNRTVQHICVAIPRSGKPWKDVARYLMNRVQIKVASDQDLPVFNTIEPGDRNGIYVKRDFGVVKFREHYQTWVGKAQPVAGGSSVCP
jgi:phenylpropionate dioxygenase-like ring-hydroxylating dioxygenase large terminal subunit